MKSYEIVYIVRPNQEEGTINKIHENFTKVLTDNGATITLDKKLGQKQLAYEIQKHTTGYYFLLNIDVENNEAIKEFDRLALISEDVIRHLIIKLEK